MAQKYDACLARCDDDYKSSKKDESNTSNLVYPGMPGTPTDKWGECMRECQKEYDNVVTNDED